jgi:predicted nucleic acid-binding protein
MGGAMTSTSNPSRVCCDANLVVRFVTNPDASNVIGVWLRWLQEEVQVIAPSLLRFEVTNAIHRLAKANKLSASEASAILENALTLPVRILDGTGVHQRALSMSRELNLPAAYDAHYLALAELEGIELFTSDQRLYNNARHRFSWIQLIE